MLDYYWGELYKIVYGRNEISYTIEEEEVSSTIYILYYKIQVNKSQLLSIIQ